MIGLVPVPTLSNDLKFMLARISSRLVLKRERLTEYPIDISP